MLGLAEIAVGRAGYSGTGHRVPAGMGDRHLPVRGPVDLMVAYLTIPEIEGEVLVQRREVEEIAADDVAAPAGAEHEAAKAAAVVALHDMQEQRPAADVDHGLGQALRDLAEPRPAAAAEDEDGYLSQQRGAHRLGLWRGPPRAWPPSPGVRHRPRSDHRASACPGRRGRPGSPRPSRRRPRPW